MKYRLIKNVKQNEEARKSFIELTQKIFEFSFVDWYENGYWQDQYIPYSLVDRDKVVSNVSINIMDFIMDGEKKKYIQLGTVMTDEMYRKQGLGRYLMEEVLEEYKNRVDGIYLFANESAVNFYPKFGFTKEREYKYSKKVSVSNAVDFVKKVDMKHSKSKELVLTTLRHMAVNNQLHMDNYGLYAFWLTGAMSDQIYYCEKEDTFVAAYITDGVLYLNQVISKHQVNLDTVIASFGNEIKEVVLGFIPLNTEGYEVKEYKEEDLTLFIMGENLTIMEKQRLRFPVLSHA